MLKTLWTVALYQPMYNLLILIILLMPHGDVGLAVILLTIIVKLILFPLTQRSIYSQLKMKEIEPELNAIKEKHKDNKVQQNKEVYALYKERKINPFSSCLLVFIQIPIIIALYLVFIRGFSGVAPATLYSFVHAPAQFNMHLFGIFDISKRSMVFAGLAGVTQFIQSKLMQGRQSKPYGDGMQAQLAKSMQVQTLYFLPIMIVFIAYRVSAAVALYWITSNIFTIGQELYTARKMRQRAQKI